MRWMVAVTVLVVGMFSTGEAAAQDWRTLVMQQLDAAGEMVRAGGQTDANVLARNQVIGVLEDGGTSYLEIRLEEGVQYLIAGACDQDCSDLDLRLLRSDDFEAIVTDVEDDDVPIIQFTAPASGLYLLGVDMADCSEDVCYYGFRAYQH
jgi:hypothetical protein